MTYILPFMLAVLVAKTVGDKLNGGIYDLYILLKGYPFLGEELPTTFTQRCCDIMDIALTTIDVSEQQTSTDLRQLLASSLFRGFPVVDGEHFVGYIERQSLEDLLDGLQPVQEEKRLTPEHVIRYTDCTVMRMLPDASLSQAHKVFKQLGCRNIFLVGTPGNAIQDALLGMLSKKTFLRYLKSGRGGHMANYPSTVPPRHITAPAEFDNNRRLPGATARLPALHPS